MTWRMLDLFSGIGGFSLVAQWVWGDELEIVAFCEIDKFCQKVLKKHWPNIPIVEDVKDVNKSLIANNQCMGWEKGARKGIRSKEQVSAQKNIRNLCTQRIDLLTGGFPCQPFSVAGKRGGKQDDRYLWPEMFRVIKEIRPRWVVAENVAGILSMVQWDSETQVEGKKGFFKTSPEIYEREGKNLVFGTGGIIDDLEGEGYIIQTFIIPACAVNAPHRRDRVWIVAYNSEFIGRTRKESKGSRLEIGNGSQDVAETTKQLVARINNSDISRQGQRKSGRGSCQSRASNWWFTEPNVGRVAHGIPSRVDRLKSLGNAIVPQVAYQIMKVIKEVENKSLKKQD